MLPHHLPDALTLALTEGDYRAADFALYREERDPDDPEPMLAELCPLAQAIRRTYPAAAQRIRVFTTRAVVSDVSGGERKYSLPAPFQHIVRKWDKDDSFRAYPAADLKAIK